MDSTMILSRAAANAALRQFVFDFAPEFQHHLGRPVERLIGSHNASGQFAWQNPATNELEPIRVHAYCLPDSRESLKPFILRVTVGHFMIWPSRRVVRKFELHRRQRGNMFSRRVLPNDRGCRLEFSCLPGQLRTYIPWIAAWVLSVEISGEPNPKLLEHAPHPFTNEYRRDVYLWTRKASEAHHRWTKDLDRRQQKMKLDYRSRN